jgi:antibiotic biosynthesis monooxygenase (ABM) superfamily enzyme
LPATGRFDNEAAMRTWLKSPERSVFRARLMSESAI